ncbi:MAG: NUDIX domain-containing protein [Euryarchaeota archaeon]|nr:NUDIX domain-containing protein [Euryarchaeota archaeon]
MDLPPFIDPGKGAGDPDETTPAPDDLDLVAKRLGPPATWRFRIPMQDGEFALLDRTGADGRWQDATILIDARRLPDPPVYDTLGIPQVHGRAGSFVAIRKQWYPEGLYRYPSGTAAPGEGIVHTALRGSARETGLEVRLVRYLLATDGEFYLGDPDDPSRRRPWRSHVFLAEPMSDTVSPAEGQAAVEARVVGGDEMLGTIHPRLLGHGLGGFHYRVGLQERALGLIGIGAGRLPEVPDAT